jgi:hypothetical protein
MKTPKSIVLALTLAVLGSLALVSTGCKSMHHHDEMSEGSHKYTCKHHPEVVQDTPGTCPKCGMKLTRMD